MASVALQVVNSASEKISEHPWATWETFWTLFPRRVAKREGEKAWARMSVADREAAITALPDWLRVWRARGDIQYVPYPATWLNGARWEDELPEEFTRQQIRPSAQAEYKPGAVAEKSVMPDKVRDAIAKLRR